MPPNLIHYTIYTRKVTPSSNDQTTSPLAPTINADLGELVAQAARRLERDELLCDDVKRERLRARLGADVVAVAHVDGPAVEFFLADNYTGTEE